MPIGSLYTKYYNKTVIGHSKTKLLKQNII